MRLLGAFAGWAIVVVVRDQDCPLVVQICAVAGALGMILVFLFGDTYDPIPRR